MTTHTLAFLLVLVCLAGCSQRQQLSQTSQAQLAILTSWRWTDALDIDSLVNATGNELIRQLKRGRIDLGDGPDNIDQTASPDSSIWVYTFSYFSGGTAGTVYNPVIQWQKKDGSFGAHGIYPQAQDSLFGLETKVDVIYRLPSSDKVLYLLMGTNTVSTLTLAYHAFVIEVKNDSLALNYPAFFEKQPLLSCVDDLSDDEDRAELDFSPETNTLSITKLSSDNDIDPIIDSYNLAQKSTGARSFFFTFENDRFVLKGNQGK